MSRTNYFGNFLVSRQNERQFHVWEVPTKTVLLVRWGRRPEVVCQIGSNRHWQALSVTWLGRRWPTRTSPKWHSLASHNKHLRAFTSKLGGTNKTILCPWCQPVQCKIDVGMKNGWRHESPIPGGRKSYQAPSGEERGDGGGGEYVSPLCNSPPCISYQGVGALSMNMSACQSGHYCISILWCNTSTV